MALVIPTAGPYVGTYAPHAGLDAGVDRYSMGVMRSGYDLLWQIHAHDVKDTTSWAQTLIEQIYLGADWSCRCHALEYRAAAVGVNPKAAGVPEAAWPWGANATGGASAKVTPVFKVALRDVGRRGTNASGLLLLTAVSGTSATSSPASLTAGQALAGPGQMGFDSKNREAPLHFTLFPYREGAVESDAAVWFVCT